jgi:hypothetical protein
MGRRIPNYLRVIGWTFLFWIAVVAAIFALVVGSGCPGSVRSVGMSAAFTAHMEASVRAAGSHPDRRDTLG